jgi:NTP pyrophosphatase (non-canonical NTP hydrolase)
VRAKRQRELLDWAERCFGPVALHQRERALRFLEEALELCQAMELTPADVETLSTYTFGRPAGTPRQEIGGVMLTLYSLAERTGISVEEEELREFDRVMDPTFVAKAQVKHAQKVEAGITG